MTILDRVDLITGFGVEKKIVCSTKRVLANLYQYFKINLNDLIQTQLNNEISFHVFVDMLDFLSNMVEENIEPKIAAPQLSSIDCLPMSKKFFYPSQIVTLRKNNDLIVKYDDDLNKEHDLNLNSLFDYKNSNFKLNKYIDYTSIKLDNLFGRIYSCSCLHDHKNCLITLNNIIQNERELLLKFNKSDLGMKLFDNIICLIKLLQVVEFELLGMVFLNLAKKEEINRNSEYMIELSKYICDFSRKISLKDLAYFLMLNTNNNKITQANIELVNCHYSHVNPTQDTVDWGYSSNFSNTNNKSKILFFE